MDNMEKVNNKITAKKIERKINLYILIANFAILFVCSVYLLFFYLIPCFQNDLTSLFKDVCISMVSASLVFLMCSTLPNYISKRKNEIRIEGLKQEIGKNIDMLMSLILFNENWQNENADEIKNNIKNHKRNIYNERVNIVYKNSDALTEYLPLTFNAIKTCLKNIEKQFDCLVELFGNYISAELINKINNFTNSKAWEYLQILVSFSICDNDNANSNDTNTYENDFFNNTIPYLVFYTKSSSNSNSFFNLAKELINS